MTNRPIWKSRVNWERSLCLAQNEPSALESEDEGRWEARWAKWKCVLMIGIGISLHSNSHSRRWDIEPGCVSSIFLRNPSQTIYQADAGCALHSSVCTSLQMNYFTIWWKIFEKVSKLRSFVCRKTFVGRKIFFVCKLRNESRKSRWWYWSSSNCFGAWHR
jgi:hypothetical protein